MDKDLLRPHIALLVRKMDFLGYPATTEAIVEALLPPLGDDVTKEERERDEANRREIRENVNPALAELHAEWSKMNVVALRTMWLEKTLA